MNGRSSRREVAVGLVTVAAAAGLLAVLVLAGDGPGFLARQRTFDVIFRDGQGLREGSPVRIAGIDSGRVVAIDLIEYEGSLRARARISLPLTLAKRLRQDTRIVVQPSLTGQSRVNVVASGKSETPLAPGQVVQGVESTFFDPVLETVGLGPVQRSDISRSIAKVREAIDGAEPKVRKILADLEQTTDGLRESAATVRPAVEATASHVEELTRKVGPKIESTLSRAESLTGNADRLIAENRAPLAAMLASTRDLTATLQDATLKNRVKVESLLDRAEVTRARADRVLYQADQIAAQGVQMMVKNRANMERIIANVKDATEWADMLVQKIYANPFVLSPLYKPTPEDTRVSQIFDTAQAWTKGAQELNDLVKTLDAMKANAKTPEQLKEVAQIEQAVQTLIAQLNQTSQRLAEGLNRQSAQPPSRRR